MQAIARHIYPYAEPDIGGHTKMSHTYPEQTHQYGEPGQVLETQD